MPQGSHSILIVDDDRDILTAAALLLRRHYAVVDTEHNPEQLPERLRRQQYDLILLDMNFRAGIHTGNEGLYWLAEIRKRNAEVAVILFTAYGQIETAVQAMKLGATDYLLKPWQNDQLLEMVAQALTKRKKTAPATTDPLPHFWAGSSPAMQALLRKVERIAPTDANVLITGENGTGKDMLARYLHSQSLRARQPFVAVDMGAIPPSLFETEMMGYRKGAFTDARQDKQGRFAAANRGTLFLDEIGNLPPDQQASLLAVLQNRQMTPLGDTAPRSLDIRLVCATNSNLAEKVAVGTFRQDLLYRINTLELHLPALRHHPEDIPGLALHFLGLFAQQYKKPQPMLPPAVEALLQAYPWPGNVRELRNCMERALILCEGDQLRPDDLALADAPTTGPDDNGQENRRLADLEANAIRRVLTKHEGNISRAARELGITRAALYRRLQKYDL